MEPFIGAIILFGGNFAIRNWAKCEGQLLAISQNSALFSILGTTFGGDGRTTFGLPDLRGRTPIHAGSGPGLSTRNIGQKGGVNTVTLTSQDVPAHTHPVACATQKGTTASANPESNFPSLATDTIYNSKAGTTTDMNAAMLKPEGAGGAHQNMQPFQGITYLIALQGIFPSRN